MFTRFLVRLVVLFLFVGGPIAVAIDRGLFRLRYGKGSLGSTYLEDLKLFYVEGYPVLKSGDFCL